MIYRVRVAISRSSSTVEELYSKILEGSKYEYDSQQRVFTHIIGISKIRRVPYIVVENR